MEQELLKKDRATIVNFLLLTDQYKFEKKRLDSFSDDTLYRSLINILDFLVYQDAILGLSLCTRHAVQ